MQVNEPVYRCQKCKDAKWYYVVQGDSEPRLVRCQSCNSPMTSSGLREHEQQRWEDMRLLSYDDDGIVPLLTYVGKQMIQRRFGFATIYGPTGNVKSMWGRILVAEACRADMNALYAHAVDVEQAFFAHEGEEEIRVPERYMTTQLLVLDEVQLLNWNNAWVMARLHKLLDSRYRLATSPKPSSRLVTVLIAQKAPVLWADSGSEWLLSRVSDGRFAMVWPTDEPVPPALVKRQCMCGRPMVRSGQRMTCECGFSRPIEASWPLFVNLPDVRPVVPPFKD